jgi:hypothetical protein
VQKFPGDAAVARRPADHRTGCPGNVHGKPAVHSYTLLSQHRETKARAHDHREDHYTPEKFRMECVSKNLLRHYRRLLNSFPGAGEGI